MTEVNWKNIDIKELAGLISAHLRKHKIDAVLVGGACVSIYSRNEYLSYDLDYVTFATVRELKPVLKELGYEQKTARHFEHKVCPFFIEFPSPPVAIGNECPVSDFSRIKTRLGTVKLFTPTDCVKDRLAAYFHWNDPQSLEQAIMVARSQKIDLEQVRKWAIAESSGDKYKVFANLLKKNRSKRK